MKTQKYLIARHLSFTLCLFLTCSLTNARLIAQDAEDPEPGSAPKIVRPSASDSASLKLIQNYLITSGGEEQHRQLRNIRVTGEYKEARDLKYFTFIETDKGKRYLRLNWKLRGVEHEQIYAYDGSEAWQQKTMPDDKRRNLPTPYKGRAAVHFINQRWFIHPFNPPLFQDYVFQYSGADNIGNRPSHLVVGYGPKNERTWFYFDQETFLVTRWGGIGAVSRGEAYLDYQAKGFKSVDGIFLPTGLTMLAKDEAYGEIIFQTVETNVEVSPSLFSKPVVEIPTLRTVPAK